MMMIIMVVVDKEFNVNNLDQSLKLYIFVYLFQIYQFMIFLILVIFFFEIFATLVACAHLGRHFTLQSSELCSGREGKPQRTGEGNDGCGDGWDACLHGTALSASSDALPAEPDGKGMANTISERQERRVFSAMTRLGFLSL